MNQRLLRGVLWIKNLPIWIKMFQKVFSGQKINIWYFVLKRSSKSRGNLTFVSLDELRLLWIKFLKLIFKKSLNDIFRQNPFWDTCKRLPNTFWEQKIGKYLKQQKIINGVYRQNTFQKIDIYEVIHLRTTFKRTRHPVNLRQKIFKEISLGVPSKTLFSQIHRASNLDLKWQNVINGSSIGEYFPKNGY